MTAHRCKKKAEISGVWTHVDRSGEVLLWHSELLIHSLLPPLDEIRIPVDDEQPCIQNILRTGGRRAAKHHAGYSMEKPGTKGCDGCSTDSGTLESVHSRRMEEEPSIHPPKAQATFLGPRRAARDSQSHGSLVLS